MKKILLTLLLHQNKFSFNTAIRPTKQILIKQGYNEEICQATLHSKDTQSFLKGIITRNGF